MSALVQMRCVAAIHRCDNRRWQPPQPGADDAFYPTGSASRSAAYWRSSALAAPLLQLCARDSDIGSGKISSCPFSTPSKMPRATNSGEAFGMSRPLVMSVSTGPVRTA